MTITLNPRADDSSKSLALAGLSFTGAHAAANIAAMTTIGIITGLAFEARLLRAYGPRVRCAGLTAHTAQRAAQALVDQGATALVSFGVAGGLEPRIAAGTVIVTSEVRAGMLSTILANADLAKTIQANIGRARNIPLAHTSRVLTTPHDKAALFAATGAVAADMESYGVAEIATRHGLSFAAVRVVADTAADAVPSVAVNAVTSDGRVRMLASIAGALLHPAQIPDLIRLGRQTAIAKAELRRLARDPNLFRGVA